MWSLLSIIYFQSILFMSVFVCSLSFLSDYFKSFLFVFTMMCLSFYFILLKTWAPLVWVPIVLIWTALIIHCFQFIVSIFSKVDQELKDYYRGILLIIIIFSNLLWLSCLYTSQLLWGGLLYWAFLKHPTFIKKTLHFHIHMLSVYRLFV